MSLPQFPRLQNDSAQPQVLPGRSATSICGKCSAQCLAPGKSLTGVFTVKAPFKPARPTRSPPLATLSILALSRLPPCPLAAHGLGRSPLPALPGPLACRPPSGSQCPPLRAAMREGPPGLSRAGPRPPCSALARPGSSRYLFLLNDGHRPRTARYSLSAIVHFLLVFTQQLPLLISDFSYFICNDLYIVIV